MKSRVLWIGCLGIILGLTGCIENAVLVKLKKDGSGSVVYRMYVSSSLTDMMQGAAGGAAGTEVDMVAQIKDGLVEQFGDSATLQSSRDIENKKGWKGVEAVFAFDDVNQLKLHELDPMGSQGGPGQDESMGENYALQFTPGDVATLKLAPMIDADAAAAADTSEEMDMSQMPLEMIKPMISGMRMAFLVAVDGEIVETNSRFQSSRQPSVITVMDVSMDRLLDHPEGAKLIQSGKGDDSEALAALDIPGVKIEQPGKEIVVKFK